VEMSGSRMDDMNASLYVYSLRRCLSDFTPQVHNGHRFRSSYLTRLVSFWKVLRSAFPSTSLRLLSDPSKRPDPLPIQEQLENKRKHWPYLPSNPCPSTVLAHIPLDYAHSRKACYSPIRPVGRDDFRGRYRFAPL
jgi:hypothetical protein